MLGHKLMQSLSQSFNVFGTLRRDDKDLRSHLVLGKMNLIGNTYAEDEKSVKNAIKAANPDVIINCIGIIKQLSEAKDPIKSITINSLFPHVLARECMAKGIRLIHLSTDCVFSGKEGYYSEKDVPDAFDLYGRSKLLGELNEPGCLTLRTSIIGRELNSTNGLLEWFLSQQGKKIRGFTNTIFSGLTTNALSDIIAQVIVKYPELEGLYHLSSDPISKFNLLSLIKNRFELEIEIEPDETAIIDRSLDSSKFRRETKITIPSWKKMIDELHSDQTPYNKMRG